MQFGKMAYKHPGENISRKIFREIIISTKLSRNLSNWKMKKWRMMKLVNTKSMFKWKHGNEKRVAKLLAKDNGKLDEIKKKFKWWNQLKTCKSMLRMKITMRIMNDVKMMVMMMMLRIYGWGKRFTCDFEGYKKSYK